MDEILKTLEQLKNQKQHIENELLLIKDNIKITTKKLQEICTHDNLILSPQWDGHRHYYYYICDTCLLETNTK